MAPAQVPVSPSRRRRVAGRALAALGRSHQEVHVTVVSDSEMRRLHARYLRRRHSTDVLAFDLQGPSPRAPLLGEIIISADTARRQARQVGVPTALELDLLLVHGMLHLTGYDDHGPRRARRMHQRARELLSAGRRRPLPARLWTGLLPDGR